jgi:hypothetical protein
VSMSYTIDPNASTLTSPASASGTVATDGTGSASVTFSVDTSAAGGAGDVGVIWTFTNPAQGTGNCIQSFGWADAGA